MANGVRQVRVLSPVLINVCKDMVSDKQNTLNVGQCFFKPSGLNTRYYTDCTIPESFLALNILPAYFAQGNDLLYSETKSYI